MEQCYEHLAHSYIGMLNMIVQVTLTCLCILPLILCVQHFFVDGAGHICQAWGACHPYKAAQPRE